MDKPKIDEVAAEYERRTPLEILKLAFEHFDNIAISFSGAEDVVLIDMSRRMLRRNVPVFSLDTGRLHPETYQFLERVREHYGLQLELMQPDTERLEALTRAKGLYSFLTDGHAECCGIRKVEPLRRRLRRLDAWITGQRKDQSPGTRAAIAVVEEDTAFSTADHRLVKINPLANWSSAKVWEYIREHQVPYNELHKQGFISIGCEPCTRAVLPNQHEREGRWWWESQAAKECGLHAANLPGAADKA